jgi:hypothetical protein
MFDVDTCLFIFKDYRHSILLLKKKTKNIMFLNYTD